jgi:hypothetical protein
MNSTDLTNATHTIVVEFVDGGGILKETSTPLTILVDNQHCVAALGTPTLNGSGADPELRGSEVYGEEQRSGHHALRCKSPEGIRDL